MGNFINSDGTTKKSFSIGRNSVRLMSGAITSIKSKTGEDLSDSGFLDKYRLSAVHSEDPTGKHIIPYLDIDIPKNIITDITFDSRKGELTLKIYSWENHTTVITKISTNAEGALSYSGDTPATPGNLAVFGTQNGTLQDTGLSVSNAIDEEADDDSKQKTIPTTKAVLDYVGSFNDLLYNRLEGR